MPQRSWPSPSARSPKTRPSVDWLEASLAPLVGASGTVTSSEREESFTAWRRFVEGIAAQRPLVLVFEDLHWADEALLAFIEHLVDWSTGVPLLVLCTARPELYERHAGWGGGKRNSNTVSLSPLAADDTARLLAALLHKAVLPAETQERLLEQAGGNPLYAEEFVRMLTDQGVIGDGGELVDGDIRVPDTVQALIAARLDTLPPERKTLLHDASVVGKVFWTGVVAEMGDRDDCGRARRPARAVTQGARAPCTHVVGEGSGRVLVLACARPRRGVLPDSARRARAEAHCRGRVDRADGR